MHTYQVAESVLDDYRQNKLTEARIAFLKAQAEAELEEIAQNRALYDSFVEKINAPERIDPLILWILFMSNEEICEAYIDACGKTFREMIPVRSGALRRASEEGERSGAGGI